MSDEVEKKEDVRELLARAIALLVEAGEPSKVSLNFARAALDTLPKS